MFHALDKATEFTLELIFVGFAKSIIYQNNACIFIKFAHNLNIYCAFVYFLLASLRSSMRKR